MYPACDNSGGHCDNTIVCKLIRYHIWNNYRLTKTIFGDKSGSVIILIIIR